MGTLLLIRNLTIFGAVHLTVLNKAEYQLIYAKSHPT
jgi:hypothetical protein